MTFEHIASSLSVNLVQIILPVDNVAAFAEELIEGGITAGVVFIGESTEDPNDLAMLWLSDGKDPMSFAVSGDSMDTVERARVAAFDFVMHCNQLQD